MGNFEKLSVVVIVVIIVMILAVAVVEWTNGPSETQPGTEPGTEKALADPLISPEPPKPEVKPKKPLPAKDLTKVEPVKDDSKTDPLKRWMLEDPFTPPAPGEPKPADKAADKAADKPATPGDSTPPPAPAPTTADIPESTHVVKEGDSLSMIAQAVWGKSSLWPAIAEANPGIRPESLRKGDTLKIPARKGVSLGAAPAGGGATGPTGGSKPVPGKEYTVQANDTWERISLAAYNTASRWPEIYVKNLNRVGGMKDLGKGKVLMIPK